MKVPRHLRSQRDTPQRDDHENDPWSRSQSQWKSGHGDHKQSHMPVIIKQDTLPGLIESSRRILIKTRSRMFYPAPYDLQPYKPDSDGGVMIEVESL